MKVSRNPINTELFQPYSSTEFKSFLVSGFFKRDLSRVDIGNGCVFREQVTGGDNIRFVSLDSLDNRLW